MARQLEGRTHELAEHVEGELQPPGGTPVEHGRPVLVGTDDAVRVPGAEFFQGPDRAGEPGCGGVHEAAPRAQRRQLDGHGQAECADRTSPDDGATGQHQGVHVAQDPGQSPGPQAPQAPGQRFCEQEHVRRVDVVLPALLVAVVDPAVIGLAQQRPAALEELVQDRGVAQEAELVSRMLAARHHHGEVPRQLPGPDGGDRSARVESLAQVLQGAGCESVEPRVPVVAADARKALGRAIAVEGMGPASLEPAQRLQDQLIESYAGHLLASGFEEQPGRVRQVAARIRAHGMAGEHARQDEAGCVGGLQGGQLVRDELDEGSGQGCRVGRRGRHQVLRS